MTISSTYGTSTIPATTGEVLAGGISTAPQCEGCMSSPQSAQEECLRAMYASKPLPRKRALVVVDYQVDFVNGALGFPGAERLEATIGAKLEKAQKEGVAIFFTLDTHDEHYPESREGRHLPVPHCVKGSPGWEVFGSVATYLPYARGVFEKQTFASLDLAQTLEGFDEVEFCGLVSNICVLSNIVLAATLHPNLTLKVDLNATLSPDSIVNDTLRTYLKALHVDCSP